MLIPMPLVKMTDFGDNLVPEGTYSLRVHKAEYVPVPRSIGASDYVKLSLVITGPNEAHVGRFVFGNYPLPKAKGDYRLKELLEVTGHDGEFTLTDPNELIGLEFSALVMIQEAIGVYPAKNVIKRHLVLR